MTDKELEILAKQASLEGENDLAIVLYTYLGSKKVGISSDFARYCQVFAKEGIKELELHKNRRNN
tara:strand:+ start:210 stop:404 length:195 start_codon:yes stop_codon:yes gene_type:complete